MRAQRKTVVDVQLKDPQTNKNIHRSINYVSSGCKYYFNAQHMFLRLTRGERAFYDYLVEHMDKSNRVTIDNTLRTRFGEFVHKVSSKKNEYKPSSAAKYINNLVAHGLLLKTTRNTLYIVNPKYVFAGTEASRKQVIKDLIEHRMEEALSIEPLINAPLQVFISGVQV